MGITDLMTFSIWTIAVFLFGVVIGVMVNHEFLGGLYFQWKWSNK